MDSKTVVLIDRELAHLVPQYLINRKTDVNKLLDALEKEDYEAVRIIGHTLKGIGSSYGFEEITAIGQAIEEVIRGNKDKNVLRHYIDRLTWYVSHVEIKYI